jgi:hypothetical protein
MSPALNSRGPHQVFGLFDAELFGHPLEKETGNLQGPDVQPVSLLGRGRDLFQSPERPPRQWD